MAKKTSVSVPPVPSNKPAFYCEPNAPWGGYINIRIDDKQKEQFFEWLEGNREHIIPSMIDMQATGLKFTMSFDHENDCFIVSVTGALVVPYPDRYCVTSRAGEMSQALALAVWKHYVVANADYTNWLPKTGGFKQFG